MSATIYSDLSSIAWNKNASSVSTINRYKNKSNFSLINWLILVTKDCKDFTTK